MPASSVRAPSTWQRIRRLIASQSRIDGKAELTVSKKMRSLLSFLLLGLLGLVGALSCTGNRLLVVIEDLLEKERYTTFWRDLEGGQDLMDRVPMQVLAYILPQIEVTRFPLSHPRTRSFRCSGMAKERTTT